MKTEKSQVFNFRVSVESGVIYLLLKTVTRVTPVTMTHIFGVLSLAFSSSSILRFQQIRTNLIQIQ